MLTRQLRRVCVPGQVLDAAEGADADRLGDAQGRGGHDAQALPVGHHDEG